jgi:hypothetical protein
LNYLSELSYHIFTFFVHISKGSLKQQTKIKKEPINIETKQEEPKKIENSSIGSDVPIGFLKTYKIPKLSPPKAQPVESVQEPNISTSPISSFDNSGSSSNFSMSSFTATPSALETSPISTESFDFATVPSALETSPISAKSFDFATVPSAPKISPMSAESFDFAMTPSKTSTSPISDDSLDLETVPAKTLPSTSLTPAKMSNFSLPLHSSLTLPINSPLTTQISSSSYGFSTEEFNRIKVSPTFQIDAIKTAAAEDPAKKYGKLPVFNPTRNKRSNRIDKCPLTVEKPADESFEAFTVQLDEKKVPPDVETTPETSEKVQEQKVPETAAVDSQPKPQESLERKRGRPLGRKKKYGRKVNELDRLHRDHNNSHHSKDIEHVKTRRTTRNTSYSELKPSKSEQDFEKRAIDDKFLGMYCIGKCYVKLMRFDEPVEKKVRIEEPETANDEIEIPPLKSIVLQDFRNIGDDFFCKLCDFSAKNTEFLEHIRSSHALLKWTKYCRNCKCYIEGSGNSLEDEFVHFLQDLKKAEH